MDERGLSGVPVRSLQTMLRTIASYNPNVLNVIPDGIYGTDTLASAASFQREYGLPVTGTVDNDTWDAILDVYRRADIETGPAAGVFPILQPLQVIYIGEINGHLYMMHGMMAAIADAYPTMPRPPYGNVHDEASVESVKWLQERGGLPVDGNIDRHTWRMLTKLYRTTVGDGTPRGPERTLPE